MFEILAATPEDLGLDSIGEFARRVEAMGYDGLFVSDAVHDGLLLAGQALAATSRLRVGISVLVAFPRSPMNVALAREWRWNDMAAALPDHVLDALAPRGFRTSVGLPGRATPRC